MKIFWTVVYLFLAPSVLLTANVAQAQDTSSHARPAKTYILSYNQVSHLTPQARRDYMNAIAHVLIAIEETQAPKTYSFFEQFLSIGSIAFADNYLYQCIGGGVPEDRDASKSTCGVQSYAGFSCPAGQKICNPIVFGVSSSGQPTCNANATTKWCFNNTTLGTTHFLEPVFKKLSERDPQEWDRLRNKLLHACNHPSIVAESAAQVREACGLVNKQLSVNEQRGLVTVKYNYGTVPSEPNAAHACFSPYKNPITVAMSSRLPESRETMYEIHKLIWAYKDQIDPRLVYHRMLGETGGDNPDKDADNGDGGYGLFQFTGKPYGSSYTYKQILQAEYAKNPGVSKSLIQVKYYLGNFVQAHKKAADGGYGCNPRKSWRMYTHLEKTAYLGWGRCDAGTMDFELRLCSRLDTYRTRACPVSNDLVLARNPQPLCDNVDGTMNTAPEIQQAAVTEPATATTNVTVYANPPRTVNSAQ